MNNYFEFEILGKPQGKERPRLSRYGTYTPTKTKNYEELVRWSFKNKYKNVIPTEKPLKVKIIAEFEPSKSMSQKKRREVLQKQTWYTQKSDIDNITKIILDALNKIIYIDDKQVVVLQAKKIYGNQNRVYVKIEEI